MNILLLGSGGGGGNILRSLQALFAKDVALARESDAHYAERLREALAVRYLDTNEFSLADVPEEQRLVIGAQTTQRLGSRHDPELARRALDESRREVERVIADYSVVIIVATGGKGTGAGTMFPLAQIARQQRKLVIPVFVRPSFERHEVDKRRYDHALRVAEQFDAAGIRLIEILNDRGYSDADPQPQTVVWERMNLPIARGLRGLLYVLWDLSQVDPSDLSVLLAGHGRMRVGFAELNPRDGREPDDTEVAEAVRGCWHNAYCAFSRPVGTSLICIQGDWSNLADAKIKGGIAALALGDGTERPYNPLYARAFATPKPWGVTALFAEYTGAHPPLSIDWSAHAMPAFTRSEPIDVVARVETSPAAAERPASAPPAAAAEEPAAASPPPAAAVVESIESPRLEPVTPRFPSVWEFARALTRADRAALEMAAGPVDPAIAIDGAEVRKLLGTFWFRSVFSQLSAPWREHLLATLTEHLVVPDHPIRVGREVLPLRSLSAQQLKSISARTFVHGEAGADLQLLLAIATLWGEEALACVQFAAAPGGGDASRLAGFFGLRG